MLGRKMDFYFAHCSKGKADAEVAFIAETDDS